MLRSPFYLRLFIGNYSEPLPRVGGQADFFMQNIQSILERRKQYQLPSSHHMAHEWQAFAYKTWKDYSNDPKELPRLIKHFRLYQEAYRPLLDAAYNFCIDYTGPIPKLRLFYWKFWQLKKNRQGS